MKTVVDKKIIDEVMNWRAAALGEAARVLSALARPPAMMVASPLDKRSGLLARFRPVTSTTIHAACQLFVLASTTPSMPFSTSMGTFRAVTTIILWLVVIYK